MGTEPIKKEKLEEIVNDEIIPINASQFVGGIALYAPFPLFPRHNDKVTGKILLKLRNNPKYSRLLRDIGSRTTGMYPYSPSVEQEISSSTGHRYPLCPASVADDNQFRDENNTYLVIQPWSYDAETIKEDEESMLSCGNDSWRIINEGSKKLLKECIADFYKILIKEHGMDNVINKYHLKSRNI